MKRWKYCLLPALLVAPVQAEAPPTVLAIKGLDPVELCLGKEVAGKDTIAEVRGRFRYMFASEENRGKFRQDPERYAIQMGGGCARMGRSAGPAIPICSPCTKDASTYLPQPYDVAVSGRRPEIISIDPTNPLPAPRRKDGGDTSWCCWH